MGPRDDTHLKKCVKFFLKGSRIPEKRFKGVSRILSFVRCAWHSTQLPEQRAEGLFVSVVHTQIKKKKIFCKS